MNHPLLLLVAFGFIAHSVMDMSYFLALIVSFSLTMVV